MKGVQVLGFKKSGKTGLCEALLAHFAALGRKPCALKCTHNPGIDKEDTDTDRFLPYCRTVGAIAGKESALFWNDPRKLSDLLAMLDGEVLVMEGGREHAVAPRVLVLHDAAEAAQLSDPGLVLAVFGAGARPGAAPCRHRGGAGRARPGKGLRPAGPGLRGLRPGGLRGACRRHPGRPGPRRTTAPPGPRPLTITVGGRPLSVNPFVERILASGIRGLVSELKGFGPGPLEIRIG